MCLSDNVFLLDIVLLFNRSIVFMRVCVCVCVWERRRIWIDVLSYQKTRMKTRNWSVENWIDNTIITISNNQAKKFDAFHRCLSKRIKKDLPRIFLSWSLLKKKNRRKHLFNYEIILFSRSNVVHHYSSMVRYLSTDYDWLIIDCFAFVSRCNAFPT